MLDKKGISGVIIGDTSVQLYLGASELEGDIDVFVTEPSPSPIEKSTRKSLSRTTGS